MSPGFGASFVPSCGWAKNRPSFSVLCLLAVGLAVLPTAAAARVWTVLAAGSGDAPTIGAAVDSAALGDTLDVGAGIFNERITVRNKTLLIRGRGMDVTEINAFPNSGNYGHAVALLGAGNFTEIRDLTISGGVANVAGDIYNGTYGGGVYGEEAVFALVRVRITDCIANSLGGGVFASFESLGRDPVRGPAAPPGPGGTRTAILVEDCVIDDNLAAAAGGGLWTEFTFMEIRGTTFRDNFSVDAGGAGILRAGVLVTGCLFENNRAEFYGGGLRVEQLDPEPAIRIEGNTFVRNSSGRDGAGLLVAVGSNVTVERNLFASQTGEGGGAAIACPAVDAVYTGGCNHFASNGTDLAGCAPIATDTAGDPLFCGADAGDYRLCADSPAIRGGCGTAGAYGVGCAGAGCATAVEPSTWSAIKSRFR